MKEQMRADCERTALHRAKCNDLKMKLYVCYGTFQVPWRPGGHPCRNASEALRAAGHEPELVRTYGLGALPKALNPTKGRREVERLTGNRWVPTLVLDDGTVIDGSQRIVEWARANPASSASPA